jgi:hypothetical protein
MIKARLFGNKITLTFTVAGIAILVSAIAHTFGYDLGEETCRNVAEYMIAGMLIFAKE